MTQTQPQSGAKKVPGLKPDDLKSQSDDTKSIEEARRLEERSDIEHEEWTNKFRRNERLRDLFWHGIQRLVWAIIMVTVVTVFVVAWHHLTPENWRWLTNSQLADLRTFLFSGAVISAVMSHVQRNL